MHKTILNQKVAHETLLGGWQDGVPKTKPGTGSSTRIGEKVKRIEAATHSATSILNKRRELRKIGE